MSKLHLTNVRMRYVALVSYSKYSQEVCGTSKVVAYQLSRNIVLLKSRLIRLPQSPRWELCDILPRRAHLFQDSLLDSKRRMEADTKQATRLKLYFKLYKGDEQSI